MLRLTLFCLGIPLKILLLGTTLSLVVFYIFELYTPKENPEYDSWDAWALYWMLIGILLILTAFIAFLGVLLNFGEAVATDKQLCMATLVLPTFFLYIPILLGFYSTLYLIYNIVPIAVTYMQYWHCKRLLKNIENGKITYPSKDNE